MGIGNLGMSELLVVAVLVLLLFGPRRLPEIGRTVGRALREFKRGMNEVKRELDEMDRSTRSREEERRETPRGRLTPPGREAPGGRTDADDAAGEESSSVDEAELRPPDDAGGPEGDVSAGGSEGDAGDEPG